MAIRQAAKLLKKGLAEAGEVAESKSAVKKIKSAVGTLLEGKPSAPEQLSLLEPRQLSLFDEAPKAQKAAAKRMPRQKKGPEQLSLFDAKLENEAQQAAQKEISGVGASAPKGPPAQYAESVSQAAETAQRSGMPTDNIRAQTEYAPRSSADSRLDSLFNQKPDQPMVPYGTNTATGGAGVPPNTPTDIATSSGGPLGRPYRSAQEFDEDLTDAGGGGGGRLPPRPPTGEMSPSMPPPGGEEGGGLVKYEGKGETGLVKYEPPSGGTKPPPPGASEAAGENKPFNRNPVEHPSRWVDWLTFPAAGAAIGGVKGFMDYDPEKEKSQLYQQTPFTARMKKAAEGAIKGAAIGFAGVGAERLVVGIGRAGLTDDQYNMLPGPMSVTRSIMEGFASTNLPGGTSAGAIKSSFQSGIANTSSYTAAVEMHSLRNQQANIGKAISNLQAQPPTAQTAQQLNNLYTSAQPMAKRMQELGNTAKYANLGDVAGTADIVKSSRGLMDVGVIAGTMVGGAAGAAVHMGRSAAKYYKEEVIAPNRKTSIQPSSNKIGAAAGRIKNPWYGAGDDTGKFAINQNLNRPVIPIENMNPFSGGAFFNTNNINAASIAGTAVAATGVAAVGASVAFGAISASAEGAPEGHPLNALNPHRDRMVSARAQLEADSSNKVRMSKPSMLGLNDADEMYYTNPNLKPQMGRHRPGMFNDDGNLTLALSTLRRG